MGVIFSRCLIVFLLVGLLRAQTNDQRTESQISPFVVHGATFRIRAAVIQEADRLTTELNKLVGEVTGKTNPIVIELLPPRRELDSRIGREVLKLPQGQDGAQSYRLQINVQTGKGRGFEQNSLQRVMIEMLLIERGLRGRPQSEVQVIALSPWIIDGISEALLWQDNKGDRRVYHSLAKAGTWMEASQLVEVQKVRTMNTLGRELFRASSGALVMALLDQEAGKAAMKEFLQEAPVYEGEPMGLIRRHFPDVNLGRKGLEKWWALSLAAMAEKPLSESMTIPETDERLENILRLHLKDEKGRTILKPLSAWTELVELSQEDRIKVLRPTADLLMALSYRSFPTYREVIAAYLKLFDDMAAGRPDEIDESLTNLRKFREAELARHEKVNDLLDWYHLNTVQNESREFEQYLQLKKSLQSSRSKKDDPVIRYVDQMQELYGR